MPVFYVVFISDPLVATVIDGMRFVADPTIKTRAHVTVRGPYARSYRRYDELGEKLRGMTIEVTGLGRFSGPRQNTVYFACRAPALEALWYKPDFADEAINPHLTLYDGASRGFASRLTERLSTHDLEFVFEASGLQPLQTRARQGSFDLYSLDFALLSRMAGTTLDAPVVADLTATERLDTIERLLEDLQHTLTPKNKAIQR